MSVNNDYTLETIILDLASRDGITTANTYAGWVTIRVIGSGYITSDMKTDAFFAFTDDHHIIIRNDRSLITEWGFRINGYSICCEIYQHPRMATGQIIFDESHSYAFQYHTGSEELQTLTFISGNTTFSDNAGQLEITVSTEPLFTGR